MSDNDRCPTCEVDREPSLTGALSDADVRTFALMLSGLHLAWDRTDNRRETARWLSTVADRLIEDRAAWAEERARLVAERDQAVPSWWRDLADALGQPVAHWNDALRLAKSIRIERDHLRVKVHEVRTEAQKDFDHDRKRRDALRAKLQAAEQERDGLRSLARSVNAIRNSIIGAQTVNWSEHVYPLVAALDAAGLVGLPYPEARANVGTLIERAAAAVRRAEAAEREADRWRHGQPIEGDYVCPNELRATNAEQERDEAFDRGRAVGREDVGKYSHAIGQIEAVLGIVGARPMRETVDAVRQLRAERDAAIARGQALAKALGEACELAGSITNWITYEQTRDNARGRLKRLRALAALPDTTAPSMPAGCRGCDDEEVLVYSEVSDAMLCPRCIAQDHATAPSDRGGEVG